MRIPRLEVITGCMFAGKTRRLIEKTRSLEKAGKKVVVVKPVIDDRYNTTEIVSHDGMRQQTRTIPMEVQPIETIKGADALVVDEVQFFSKEVVDYLLATPTQQIIMGGLDLDWKGNPFGQMPRILCYADQVIKLHAVCAVCGASANRTSLVALGEAHRGQTIVGGPEKYEPRCTECFEDWMHNIGIGLFLSKE